MRCEHITELLKICQGINTSVLAVLADPELGGMRVDELQEVVEERDRDIEGVIDEHFSADAFMRHMGEESRWRIFAQVYDTAEFKEKIKKDARSEYFYNLVRVVFANHPIRFRGTEEIKKVYEFIRNLPAEMNFLIYEHFLNRFEGAKQKDEMREIIIDALRSAYINRIIERTNNIRIENGFTERSCYVAAGLPKGKKVHVAHASYYLGYCLNGGEITYDHASGHVGMMMNSGVIRGEHGGELAGMLMRGGRMYFKMCGEKAGQMSSGGTIFSGFIGFQSGEGSYGTNFITGNFEQLPHNKKGGCVIAKRSSIVPVGEIEYTALVDSLGITSQERELAQNLKKSFVYGYQNNEYFEHLHGAEILRPKTDDELDSWKVGERGLCVIEDISNFQKPVTEGMKDGIMVIRIATLPDNIGVGMEGGVIIFDHQDLTPEKVKGKVYYDPVGAPVMLIRVPDEEDKDIAGKPGTKLVEIV